MKTSKIVNRRDKVDRRTTSLVTDAWVALSRSSVAHEKQTNPYTRCYVYEARKRTAPFADFNSIKFIIYWKRYNLLPYFCFQVVAIAVVWREKFD